MQLIYNRTKADVESAAAIRAHYQALADWTDLTDAERAQLERGTYTAVSLNRVEAACKEIAAALTAAGYPVEYKPAKRTAYILTSADFQQAPYLYATGKHDLAYSDGYISTIDFYSLSSEDAVVTANIALGRDSGFLWYDGSKAFISGAVAAQIDGAVMTASPPDGAAYCKFNLNAAGITPAAITEVNLKISDISAWQSTDIIRLPQWEQYLANVQSIRDALPVPTETPDLPSATDRLDYIGANAIEKILADVYLLIDWMQQSYRPSGTFQSGSNAAHLPLKRSVS